MERSIRSAKKFNEDDESRVNKNYKSTTYDGIMSY